MLHVRVIGLLYESSNLCIKSYSCHVYYVIKKFVPEVSDSYLTYWIAGLLDYRRDSYLSKFVKFWIVRVGLFPLSMIIIYLNILLFGNYKLSSLRLCGIHLAIRCLPKSCILRCLSFSFNKSSVHFCTLCLYC